MKAKLKSANGFTRFMLAHGEKLGMTAVVAVALLLIWKSLGRERLAADKQPTNLSEKATQATTKVSSMQWEAFPEPQKIVSGTYQVAEARMKPVDGELLGNIDEFDPYPIPRAGKRADPELLPLEKLEVASGSAIWVSADENVIKRAKLEALKQEQEAERLAEEQRLQDAAEGDGGDGGRGGRGGRRGGRGGRGGDSGFGGGRGGMGDGTMTKDGTMVVRPTGGVPLQGYEEFKNTSWVLVKALIPIRAQHKEYREALFNARGYNPATDMPRYKGYQVERAEVTEEGDGKWAVIARVVPKTLIDAMETWPIQTPDLINPRYNHPLLTYPLPPMVLRAWDASVTHSELPLPGPEDYMMDGGGDGGGDGRPSRRPNRDGDAEEGGDLFEQATRRAPQPGLFSGGGDDGGRPRGFPGGGGMDGGGPRGFPGGGRGYGGDSGRGGGDGGRGGTPMGMLGGGEGAYATEQFENFVWDEQTQYLLFRYFDTKVEPGKKYRYRVALVLQDVNAAPTPSNPLGIQDMYLENEVIARRTAENRTYRLTEWSEPSPVAIVPQAGLVFVASAEPANANNFNAEPTAQLLIKSLDTRAAAEVALAEAFTRGSVLNLLARKAKVMWSSSFEAVDRDGEPVNAPEFSFRTGLTLLDMSGGEPLNGSRTLTGPARAMLMDSAGRLTIHRELNDATPVREYNAYIEMAADQLRQAKEREEGGGGRDGGRGGGGPRGGGGRGGGG